MYHVHVAVRVFWWYHEAKSCALGHLGTLSLEHRCTNPTEQQVHKICSGFHILKNHTLRMLQTKEKKAKGTLLRNKQRKKGQHSSSNFSSLYPVWQKEELVGACVLWTICEMINEKLSQTSSIWQRCIAPKKDGVSSDLTVNALSHAWVRTQQMVDLRFSRKTSALLKLWCNSCSHWTCVIFPVWKTCTSNHITKLCQAQEVDPSKNHCVEISVGLNPCRFTRVLCWNRCRSTIYCGNNNIFFVLSANIITGRSNRKLAVGSDIHTPIRWCL